MEILVGESVSLYIWCGNGIPHLFFKYTPLPASYNYWTKDQLNTKSDAFLSTIILLSPIFFVNLLYGVSKIALQRYTRVSFKKLNGWKFGHRLTANFTFPPVTWNNTVWSFSMPLWCNKHLPEQGASIIIAFEFFGMFVSTRTSNVFWGEVKLCLFLK